MNEEIKAIKEREIAEAKAEYDRSVARIEKDAERAELAESFREIAKRNESIYDAHVEAGFTEAQAFEITKIIVANVTRPSLFSL